jgi:hypothetical protein
MAIKGEAAGLTPAASVIFDIIVELATFWPYCGFTPLDVSDGPD